MKTRTFTVAAAVLGAVATLTPGAAMATPSAAKLVIRHEVRGCHTWSLNAGSYGVNQTVKLSRGGTLTITDFDMMPHQLSKQSGPAIVERLINPGKGMMGKLKPPYATGLMPHMGATLRITFPAKGVYKMRTASGEDYVPLKTVGEDNVLRVTVVVS